jgi:FkbM family methyltransferase
MKLDQFLRKSNLGKLLKRLPFAERSLGLLYYGLLRKPYFSRAVEINLGGEGPIRLDYRFGHYRYEEFGDRHNSGFKKWLSLCEGKSCVLDAGAHIGLYALPASKRLAKGGKVYAFEPSNANRKYLLRHCRYNDISNIEIVPFLLGDQDKSSTTFYEGAEPAAMSSVLPRNDLAATAVQKPQITIDQFCKRLLLKPEVVKVDVEGAEVGVLQGAEETLAAYHPTLLLSVHPKQIELLGHPVKFLEDFLRRSGYEIRDTTGKPARELGFGEYLVSPL